MNPSEVRLCARISAQTAKQLNPNLSEQERDTLVDAVVASDEELRNDAAGAKLFWDIWTQEYRQSHKAS